MKRITFAFAIMGLLLLSCNKSVSTSPKPTSLEGAWRMIVVKDNVSGLTITKSNEIPGDVDIVFTPGSLTNGTFTGNTPTNEIWQNSYSVGINQSITIPCLSMTKVMETTWGDEFVDNICSSQNYSFEKDGLLIIKTINKTLTFRRL